MSVCPMGIRASVCQHREPVSATPRGGTMTTIAPYALDNAWHAERARLNSLTALYDPATLAICDRLGLASGCQCLDVGAGTGSLAEALAERVAPSGGVVAADIDTRFLEPLAGAHLEPIAL